MNTRTEAKAQRLVAAAQRVLESDLADLKLALHHDKTRYVCTFFVELEAQTWNDAVVEVLELGQRLGYGWTVSGDVLADFHGDSSTTNVSGIDGASWSLRKTWDAWTEDNV